MDDLREFLAAHYHIAEEPMRRPLALVMDMADQHPIPRDLRLWVQLAALSIAMKDRMGALLLARQDALISAYVKRLQWQAEEARGLWEE